jgi:adenylosuccinate synthase
MPKLFKTDIASTANLKVFVTDIRSEADLVVYETTDAWAATESQIWCYTDIQSEADKIVYFVGSQFEADLAIYKTDVQSDAVWLNSEKSNLL